MKLNGISMKQTSVEWLVNEIPSIDWENSYWKNRIQQAKELEKQQIINCCIDTTQDCFISMMSYVNQNISFTEEDLENQRKEAEQYYTKTYETE